MFDHSSGKFALTSTIAFPNAVRLGDWAGSTELGLENYRTTVVALIHPSLRHASLRHRRYKGMEGEQAEVLMLRDGIVAVGLAVL